MFYLLLALVFVLVVLMTDQEDDMDMELNPLYWLCRKCGWSGTVKEMTTDYKCPKCGEFHDVKIMIFFSARVIGPSVA
jgi:predicted RNA-binding Zn-ribbon protein involved in translation (DUF1610 family)